MSIYHVRELHAMVPMTKFSCVARMSLIYYFNRHGERKVAKRPRKEFSSAKVMKTLVATVVRIYKTSMS